MTAVTLDRDGHVLLIGVNRPDAYNMWDLEVIQTAIFPLGGATFRLPSRLGPAGARYLVTAERFDAETAFRLGLVSEVVPPGRHLERALELARVVASNAPLAIQAALASARAAERASRDAASAVLFARNAVVTGSADAAEGIAALLEKRSPVFRGK
jgi:enoyl-CoA hydratase/carnithine racemase